jgi:predicted TIM-barrel fold metal-dependent hydrolase
MARAKALGVPIYIHPGNPPDKVREAHYGGLE